MIWLLLSKLTFLPFHLYMSVIHAGLTSVFQIYQISALFEVFTLIVELVSVQSTRTQIIMQHNISQHSILSLNIIPFKGIFTNCSNLKLTFKSTSILLPSIYHSMTPDQLSFSFIICMSISPHFYNFRLQNTHNTCTAPPQNLQNNGTNQ